MSGSNKNTEVKLLCIDRVHEAFYARMVEAGIRVDTDLDSPPEEIRRKIGAYDGLVLRSRMPVDRALLKAGKRLKCVVRVGSGLEGVDLETARQLGINVYNTPEGNSNAVGEMAVGLLLSLLRDIPSAASETSKGIWRREAHRGWELEGKTVAIIGYGHTGKSFARKLAGFGTDTIFYDILPGLEDRWAREASYDEIFRRADVVSLHVPLTPFTRGMVNREFIRRFHKPFYLINTARGEAVVTADLVEALKEGRIKGAALDVIEYENPAFGDMDWQTRAPQPLRELMAMPQVILTPHIAGLTRESARKLAEAAADKILRCLQKTFS
ncbi:MAG: hydroxyacid dehydrogenase [Chlorobi bacterium]|nr:hydroxyacid dehydrogenase [Chlorobiota bacterium]